MKKKKAEAAVVAVITDRRGRVLLSRRTREPKAGMWHMPGGAIEFGERLDEALKRELREELGVDVEVIGRLPVALANVVFPSSDPAAERHVVILYFRAAIARGTPRAKDGTDAVGWFDRRLVAKLVEKEMLLDSCRQAIRQALGWDL